MRDFLVVLVVLGSVPLTLVRPFVGILMWFWLGLMNPHRMSWGYAQQFRVALVVGAATLLGWVASREAKTPPKSAVIFALAALTFWVSVAALFAIHPEVSIPKWEEIIKILGMTFVTTCIVRSRERIDQLVWIIVLSLGFYGVKGGIFSILTAGHYRVWGPPGTFIEDNNSLALALIMLLPLIQYLRTITKEKWIRLGLMGATALTIISILCSYSRGAFLGMLVMIGYLLLKTRHRLMTGLLVLGVFGVGISLMPHQWFQRMHTIDNYEQDGSVQGRFDAWNFAFRLALDHPLTGGGQLIGLDDQLFMHYVPTASVSRAAHSIYFEVLGETGFVGLGIYLLLLYACFRAARNIILLTSDRPDLVWARTLASMLQVSLVGYTTSGAFLSLGFFDLYYALVALITVTQFVVRQTLRERSFVTSTVFNSGNLPSVEGALLPQPIGKSGSS